MSKDKVTIMARILSDQDLCKAIYYTDSNFLSKPDMDMETASPLLLYKNIFPYRQVPPDDETTVKTFITMSFGGYRRVTGGFYKSGKIWINAIVNLDNMRTDYGILRTDYIIGKIDELVNSERGIGIGKVMFESMDDFYVNKSYVGAQICYKLVEFN